MSDRLLLIYYQFPPVQVPGAHRMKYFYEKSRSRFDQVWVFTSINGRYLDTDASLETHCPNLIELPTLDWRGLRARHRSGKTNFVPARWTRSFPGRWLQRLTNSFPWCFLLGDGGLLYILQGYLRGCRLIRERKITHLLSTYRPLADHVIAYLLKQRFSRLHWTADYRDLHVDPIRRSVWWPALQHVINRWLLRKADELTTVSRGLQEELQRYGRPVRIVRNGVRVPVRDDGTSPSPVFTLSYTGSLHPELQDPQPLLAGIRCALDYDLIPLHHLHLQYAGKDTAFWQKGIARFSLEDWSDSHGMLSHADALHMQQTAAMNILLTWASPALTGILTSKLFEYLAARRPVLVMIRGWDEELFELLGNRPGIYWCRATDPPLRIAGQLSKAYQRWLTGHEKPAFSYRELACMGDSVWPVPESQLVTI